MQVYDLLRASFDSIRRNTTRSFLTVLGIVIGIAAVIIMLSIGQGAQGYVLNQVASLGSDQVFVESGSGDQSSGPPSAFTEQTLTLKDIKELRTHGPFSFVSATLISTATVQKNEVSNFTNIAGVDEYQLEVFPADVASGRFIEKSDVDAYASVAVLGIDSAKNLFGDQDPIGEKIKIKGITFRVIGVMERQGSKFFQNLDDRIYIPVTTMQRSITGSDKVTYLAMRATGDLDFAKDEARYILRDSHDIDNPNGDLAKDDFNVSSQQDAANIIGSVGFALTLLLAAIAAISLLVGGIGIMNIMLVSVTERTREIGLRKAIGATESDILRQFLAEAVILTLGGGVLGVVSGIGISFFGAILIQYFVADWPLVIPMSAVLLAFAVSSGVGLIFGIYPAQRAAKLDPIEALRYE